MFENTFRNKITVPTVIWLLLYLNTHNQTKAADFKTNMFRTSKKSKHFKGNLMKANRENYAVTTFH